MRTQEFYAVVSSGGTVSAAVGLSGARVGAIWAPVVDSCQVYMRGSFDTTSADFVSLYTQQGIDRWTWDVDAGSRMMVLDAMISAPWVKIETSVAQTDTRTFVIGVKL